MSHDIKRSRRSFVGTTAVMLATGHHSVFSIACARSANPTQAGATEIPRSFAALKQINAGVLNIGVLVDPHLFTYRRFARHIRDLSSRQWQPDPFHQSLIQKLAHVASIAIERTRGEEDRKVAEDLLAGEVILNLLLNAADAMNSVEDRPRHLIVENTTGDRRTRAPERAGCGRGHPARERRPAF